MRKHVSEVDGESAYHMIDHIRAVQAGGRASDDLVLVEFEVDIVEFVFREQGDVLVEKVFRSGEQIESRPGVVRGSTELIGRFGEEHAQTRSGIKLQGTARVVAKR